MNRDLDPDPASGVFTALAWIAIGILAFVITVVAIAVIWIF